jgi:hypothetical protein
MLFIAFRWFSQLFREFSFIPMHVFNKSCNQLIPLPQGLGSVFSALGFLPGFLENYPIL